MRAQKRDVTSKLRLALCVGHATLLPMPLPYRPLVAALAGLGALALTTANAQTPASPPAAKQAQAPKPMIGSTVFNWEKLVVRPTPHGERRDVANNPTQTLAVFECHITTLNPGRESHAPHRHAQEELIIVKEGTVEVHLNGQTQVAGPGSTLFYASNDAHAVKNVGTTRATYWVINVASTVTHTPAEHNQAPTLKSAVFDFEKLTDVPTKTGSRRGVLSGTTPTLNKLESHITTVNARDASHAAHRHPDEEWVIVREGSIEFTINGKSEVAGPGSIAFFASNDLHGMRNVGDTRAMYHIIRIATAATPKPAPAAKK